jgi:hypothetical protein
MTDDCEFTVVEKSLGHGLRVTNSSDGLFLHARTASGRSCGINLSAMMSRETFHEWFSDVCGDHVFDS